MIADSESTIERALQATLPKTAKQQDRSLFRFARELKAISELASVDTAKLQPFVRQWHALAQSAIGDGAKDFDTTWFDFNHVWTRVRHPAQDDLLKAQFEIAKQQPLPAVAMQFESTTIRQLVGLCWQLQLTAGRSPFFLSCRSAGRLLGIDHMTAARCLEGLVSQGVLIETKKGSPASMKATRYRFPKTSLIRRY